jgi:hypothetical protein
MLLTSIHCIPHVCLCVRACDIPKISHDVGVCTECSHVLCFSLHAHVILVVKETELDFLHRVLTIIQALAHPASSLSVNKPCRIWNTCIQKFMQTYKYTYTGIHKRPRGRRSATTAKVYNKCDTIQSVRGELLTYIHSQTRPSQSYKFPRNPSCTETSKAHHAHWHLLGCWVICASQGNTLSQLCVLNEQGHV